MGAAINFLKGRGLQVARIHDLKSNDTTLEAPPCHRSQLVGAQWLDSSFGFAMSEAQELRGCGGSR